MADNRLAPTSSGAGISHLGTITADVLEEDRAGYIVNNDQEMLEANAVLEAEAEGREKLETLQYQLKTKRSQMKILQECTSPTPPPQRSPQRPASPPDTGVRTTLLCAFLFPLRRVSVSHLATSSGDGRRRVHGTDQPPAHDRGDGWPAGNAHRGAH